MQKPPIAPLTRTPHQKFESNWDELFDELAIICGRNDTGQPKLSPELSKALFGVRRYVADLEGGRVKAHG
jgi:hypothetical protein